MKSNELLILAEDVAIVPVSTLSGKFRKGFESETGDMVITNYRTRSGSKVLSHAFAELIGQFKTPKTPAEAIYAYAVKNNTDALVIADEVFSLLLHLQNSGFLIPYLPDAAPPKKTLLDSLDSFREYKVLGKYGNLEDTEVYRVADTAGNLFALKLLKPSVHEHFRVMFDNEVRILGQLDGKVNPVVKEYGNQDDILYIVMDWVDGITSKEAAAKYSNINLRDNVIKLMDICIAIAGAFDHLHRQGVMHGDIHPRHIYITGNGKVKLIDFGYAASQNDEKPIRRGGTEFYYEPEFVKASAANLPQPLLTERGEQYAVAVVLYRLLTGRDYLDFSLEKEKLYQQIAEELPLPFLRFDLLLPGELEAVLKKALSKDPENRYESLQQFAEALQQVRNTIFDSTHFFVLNREQGEKQFTEFLIRKFGWESPLIEKGLRLEPCRSINYGSAGIAYMFYRMACVREDASLLALADVWINRAAGFEKEYEKSFYSTAFEINDTIVSKRSLYHSPAGIYLVHALISRAKGDNPLLSENVTGFLRTVKQPCEKIDLTLGKAGVLVGSALLFREFTYGEDYHTTSLEKAADDVMKEMWDQLDSFPSMKESNPVNYFGVAHGWTGLLYSTLQWCSMAGKELPVNFLNRLQELLDCAVQKNKSIYWPVSVSNTNPWPGWCNGSAGNLFFWLLAYRYFKEEKFLQTAEGLATHFEDELQGNNGNLCCGLAGQAYAMLALYKTTHNKQHLDTAQRIKKLLLKNLSSPLLLNNSLYKGEVGVGVLFCESENPDFARMPLFE